ncbi:MAG TPA: glycosyltransferase [Humisphaera sp.]
MTVALIVLLSLLAAGWVALWLSPAHRVGFREVLDADASASAAADPAALPRVTVMAPARNEAGVLPETVPTYCGQSYPNLAVVVVDDQSDDATPAVLERLRAEHPGLRVVRTAERPAGWVGKTWAVASGVEAVRAAGGPADAGTVPGPGPDEVYVFTDADCAFHPNAVATVVRVMRERDADLLSVLPRMQFGPACEKLGLPGLVTVLSMVFPLGKVNDPASPLALAAGGFIAVKRSAYERAGGHEAVRHHVVEDVNLARLVKQSGGRLDTRLTRDLVSTRMYDGWGEMWEGLSKNAYAGMDFQPRKFWVGLVVGTLMMVLPPVYLLGTGAWVLAGLLTNTPTPLGWVAFVLSIVVVAAQAAVHGRTTRHMGLPAYHALLMPASVAFYLTVACASAYQHHFRGGTVWKGRKCLAVAPAAEAGS